MAKKKSKGKQPGQAKKPMQQRHKGNVGVIMGEALAESLGLNGYVPLDAKMTAADAEREIASLQAPSPPDARIVGNFSRMLAAANAKGVPIVVVSSPGFHSRQEQGTLDSLCRDAGVPYIDMFGMELFDEHPEWFADVYHLNDDGARVFTALFFERLRPILDSIPSFAR